MLISSNIVYRVIICIKVIQFFLVKISIKKGKVVIKSELHYK
jgi:hypothetical protein